MPDDATKLDALDAIKAAQFMAFAKGAAVMGNREIGDVEGYGVRGKAVFDEWWERYGKGDAERAIEKLAAERDAWKRRAAQHGCDIERGDPECG